MARQSANARGYNYRWQKARKRYFSKHPLCVHCLQIGMVEPATDLDHITPHKGDESLFWDEDNWQGLCKSCHSRKTSAEDGGFDNAAAPRRVIGPDGYPTEG